MRINGHRRSVKRGLAGLTAGLVLLWVGGSAHSGSFSNASLNGSCIWQILAVPTTSGDQTNAGPVTTLSWATFDGAGNVTIDYDVNIDGAFSSSPPVRGTYNVDPSGHGTLIYLSPVTGNAVESDFFITPLGQAILTQTRGYGAQQITPRVSNGSCVFSD